MASSAISNFLAALKTNPSELPPAVRFVPAAYLFVHAEPLPDGMQPAEIEGFASVTLEGLSPLPIDQLAWGYLTQEKSRHVLLFGAFQDRLALDNLSPDESFYHVLPSFYATAPMDGGAHWVFLWEAGHVAALHYHAGELIPARIEIEKLGEDTVAAAFAGRENLLKRLGAHARTEATEGLLAHPDAARGTRERLKFSFDRYTSPEAAPTRVPGNAPGGPAERWTADLRGGLFRASEQKNRKASIQATRILQVAGAVAVLLVIGQAVVFAGRIWVNKADSLYGKQKPDVDLIDQRVALLGKISQFTDKQLHPFEMLGMINPFRPKEITFGKTKLFENNKLTVDCQSADGAAVQTFVDRLQNSGIVAVDLNALHLNAVGLNRVKFQLNLTFNNVPEAQTTLPPVRPVALPEPEPLAQADFGATDAQMNAQQQQDQGGPGFQQGQGDPFQGQGGQQGFQQGFQQGQGGPFQGQGGQGPQGGPQGFQPADIQPAAPQPSGGATVYQSYQPQPAPAPAPQPEQPAPAPAPVYVPPPEPAPAEQ